MRAMGGPGGGFFFRIDSLFCLIVHLFLSFSIYYIIYSSSINESINKSVFLVPTPRVDDLAPPSSSGYGGFS